MGEIANNLQEAWDRYLINTYYQCPYKFTWVMVKDFLRKHEISKDEFSQLLRTPLYWQYKKMTVSRFICGFIPKLGVALSNTEADDVIRRSKIIDTLKRSKLTTNDTDECKQTRDDRKELGASRKYYRQKRDAFVIESEALQSLNRNNQWNMCK